ncbi:hypothetical protein Tco_0420399 [Tanacetum coccineum]
MEIYRQFEEMLRPLKPIPLVGIGEPEGSDDYTEVPFNDEQILRHHNTAPITPPPLAYTPPPPVLATMEPLDTFLMGDKLTLDSTVLECSMPIDPPLPRTNVLGDAIVDINLPLGEHLDTLSMRDREVDFNPSRGIEELERLLADDPVPVPMVFEELLGNPDSVSRSLDTSDLNLEELIAEIGLDDSISTEIDDGYYDSEGDILFLEHLLIEETFSDPTPAVLPKKSTLLVTPPLASKQFSLREVERFDLFSP